ncbi:23543_t:CDS:1, partial [Gigaspora rosea]
LTNVSSITRQLKDKNEKVREGMEMEKELEVEHQTKITNLEAKLGRKTLEAQVEWRNYQ